MYNILLYFVYISEQFGRIRPEQGMGCIFRKINMTTALTLDLNIIEGRE